jgi:3-isopropylmalate/(R)-2-methylmalate dehydratase small subunit
MIPFGVLSATAAVIERDNVDTDQIIPARFLRKPRSAGYNTFLFHDLRGVDPAFPLGPSGNPPILLASANFGCGSSREGAVYALVDGGVRCVIAPSFGDIFAGNAAKNGLLTVELSAEQIATLLGLARLGAEITVDLPAQQVRAANRTFGFQIDPFRKHCLLEGLDDIGLTLACEAAIAAFEAADRESRPWAEPSGKP